MTPTHHDPVLFRTHPGAHQEKGFVIGRCKDRHGWRFDVMSTQGRFDNLTDVVLDEEEAERLRQIELDALGE